MGHEDIESLSPINVKVAAVKHYNEAVFDSGKKQEVYSLVFEGKSKELILNACNRKALMRAYGSKVKSWIGQDIELYVKSGVRSPGGNGTTKGIRIKAGEHDAGTIEKD